MQNSTLSAYRRDLYPCFLSASDALMNLNDALLSDTAAHSFVELTLSPFFVREGSSAYAACKDGVLDVTAQACQSEVQEAGAGAGRCEAISI